MRAQGSMASRAHCPNLKRGADGIERALNGDQPRHFHHGIDVAGLDKALRHAILYKVENGVAGLSVVKPELPAGVELGLRIDA